MVRGIGSFVVDRLIGAARVSSESKQKHSSLEMQLEKRFIDQLDSFQNKHRVLPPPPVEVKAICFSSLPPLSMNRILS